MNNLTLLIPANKEAESLPIFLNELINYNYKKMVVLQKEDEKTINSIKDFNDIQIIIQKKRGYGSALKEGLENVKTEFFCIINADGSMDPKYLNQMLIDCENNDLIFASRYLKGGGSDDDNFVTFIGNKGFSFLGNFLFKLGLSDILYTYILGRTVKAKELNLKYNDFRICVEIPIMAKYKKYRFYQLQVWKEKNCWKKKVNAIKDGFLILTAIFSLLLKRY